MTDAYRQDITLNERDSLIDLLNLEKEIVKVYSTALTEATSKGFRNLVKKLWEETASDQLQVFLLLTKQGYLKVESAGEKNLKELKANFSKIKNTL